jgi:hypothetical protein
VVNAGFEGDVANDVGGVFDPFKNGFLGVEEALLAGRVAVHIGGCALGNEWVCVSGLTFAMRSEDLWRVRGKVVLDVCGVEYLAVRVLDGKGDKLLGSQDVGVPVRVRTRQV